MALISKVLIPKTDTKCSDCFWGVWKQGKSVLESGYICRLNPFQRTAMGIEGKHSKREEILNYAKD